MGLVVGALVLALLKPWELTAPRGTGSNASATQITAQQPSPSASLPRGPASCYSHDEWRLVTAERTLGKDIRSWIAIVPVPATEPTDPAIPTLALVSDRLLGIGICAPPALGIAAGSDDSTVLWAPRGRTAVPVQLVSLQPLVEFGSPEEGQLYKPPPELGGPGNSWPKGRYLMELRRGVGDHSLWFAFTVTSPPATPTPRST